MLKAYVKPELFKCPLGLSHHDAICIDCKEIQPEKWECWIDNKEKDRYIYPGHKDIILDRGSNKPKSGTCTEWKKKMIFQVCGCGGSIKCTCGYSNRFCWRSEDDTNECPFCGREFTVEYSPLHKIPLNIWNEGE